VAGTSATVVATPTKVLWDPGDGSPAVECDGPGRPWEPADGSATPDCGHTYTVRSTIDDPQGTYRLRATITYAVSWTATNGDGGDLDPISATTTVPLTVHEIQAMIDAPGR
jgi:hypothetical protein